MKPFCTLINQEKLMQNKSLKNMFSCILRKTHTFPQNLQQKGKSENQEIILEPCVHCLVRNAFSSSTGDAIINDFLLLFANKSLISDGIPMISFKQQI